MKNKKTNQNEKNRNRHSVKNTAEKNPKAARWDEIEPMDGQIFEKMLPESVKNNLTVPTPKDSTIDFLGRIYSDLKPGESTNIKLTKNRDNSATMRCPEQGMTLVKRPSGNDVGYMYKPKK